MNDNNALENKQPIKKNKIYDHSILYSVQVERNVLSGLIKFPDHYHEIESKINDDFFFNNAHRKIFQVIKNVISSGQEINGTILAQKILDYKIDLGEDIDPFTYIESITFSQINFQGLLQSIKEIEERKIRRDMYQTISKMADELVNPEVDLNSAITNCEKEFGRKISSFDILNDPNDLFDGIIEEIEKRAKNPIDDIGYLTPYSKFNEIYGGIRGGNIYAFVARAKAGKTTFLNDMAFRMTKINDGLKVLILDTEMQTNEIKFRIASSVLDIPTWYLETGNYLRSKEYKAKFLENKDILEEYKQNVFHSHVAGKPIERIASIIRRWYAKQKAAGFNKCMIVYDYIKLTGEKVANNWSEYQAIGGKIDMIKQLSVELNIPILTACQANRSGSDDHNVVALSDRLSWFATAVFHFRRKNENELKKFGDKWGTHSLIEIVARFQGKNATGHNQKIKIPSGEKDHNGKTKYVYLDNFINFDVKNFRVEERGTLTDIINDFNNKRNIQKSSSNSDSPENFEDDGL